MKSCIDLHAACLIAIVLLGCSLFNHLMPVNALQPETYNIEELHIADMGTLDMQIELNRRGHNLVEDGDFGTLTHDALLVELGK